MKITIRTRRVDGMTILTLHAEIANDGAYYRATGHGADDAGAWKSLAAKLRTELAASTADRTALNSLRVLAGLVAAE